MKPRIIKTQADYESALSRIDALMESDPAPDTDAGAELELLVMLVEQYEEKHYPMEMPTPVEAIKFRMDQAGLKQVDLIPYIGSKSKVSEVLNGKRPLSLNMIRNLHKGLGIPAEVLLQDATETIHQPVLDVAKFPIAEMIKRNYLNFRGSVQEAKEYGEEVLTDFLDILCVQEPQAVYCRRTDKQVSEASLVVWQARVLRLIQDETLPAFSRDAVGHEFAATLAKLSYSTEGPKTAVEFLNKKGIHVAFLAHLPKTYLDGASFLGPKGNPVIGMTLRHDRIDNFWFTLLHELGHVHLHLHNQKEVFFDDTDELRHAVDTKEKEANAFAANALIPEKSWKANRPNLITRPADAKVRAYAESLNIHSAIVAGRIRWERDNYKLLPQLTNGGKLKKLFALNP